MDPELESILTDVRSAYDRTRRSGRSDLRDIRDELELVLLDLVSVSRGVNAGPRTIEAALGQLTRDNIRRLGRKKRAQLEAEKLDEGALKLLEGMDDAG